MVAGRLEVVSVILWYDRGMMRTLMGAPLKAAPARFHGPRGRLQARKNVCQDRSAGRGSILAEFENEPRQSLV